MFSRVDRYHEVSLYFQAMCGWYEAWVIYSFYAYLQAYLERGSPPGTLAHLPVVTGTHPHAHVFPCGLCMRPWGMADGEFVAKCKRGVLQYALVQTGCTAVTFATQYARQFHDGEISYKHSYMYVTIAINVSQMVALYCLVHFYHTFNDVLAPLHPLPKFLCVKLVVFFSFWQDMLIAALVHWHVIRAKDSWTTYTVEDVANGIQAFLMCLEMLIAAIAHSYAFPTADYVPPPGSAKRPKFGANLVTMFSVGDVADDIGVVFGCVRPPPAPPAGSEGEGGVEEGMEEGEGGVGDIELASAVGASGAPAARLAAASGASAAARSRSRPLAVAPRRERSARRAAAAGAPPPPPPAQGAGAAAGEPPSIVQAFTRALDDFWGVLGFGQPSTPYPYSRGAERAAAPAAAGPGAGDDAAAAADDAAAPGRARGY
jgi:hypothetical protein